MYNLLDDDSLAFCNLIRDRRLLIDTIIDIEQALDNPAHGAHDSDLHNDIKSIIYNLKSQWKGT
jgi:hypothetical protein